MKRSLTSPNTVHQIILDFDKFPFLADVITLGIPPSYKTLTMFLRSPTTYYRTATTKSKQPRLLTREFPTLRLASLRLSQIFLQGDPNGEDPLPSDLAHRLLLRKL